MTITLESVTDRLVDSSGNLTPTGMRAQQAYQTYVNAGLSSMGAAQLLGGQLVEDPHLNPLQVQGDSVGIRNYQEDGTTDQLISTLQSNPSWGVGISQWTYLPRQQNLSAFLATLNPNGSAFEASLAATIFELGTPEYAAVMRGLTNIDTVPRARLQESPQMAAAWAQFQAAYDAQAIVLPGYENPRDHAIGGPNFNERLVIGLALYQLFSSGDYDVGGSFSFSRAASAFAGLVSDFSGWVTNVLPHVSSDSGIKKVTVVISTWN